jgi:FkbM family methyltransferase
MSLTDIMDDARSLLSGVGAILGSADISGAASFLGRTALRSKKPVRVKVRSIPIFVRPCTPDLDVAKLSFSGEFDAAIAAARPLKYRFIIDAGGYIGTAAIKLAKAFPEATIVSIEPSRDNFAMLAMNVRFYPNIVPLNTALGSAAGSTGLVDRGTGEVGFSTVQSPADTASPLRLHEVAVKTVPDLMKRFGVSGIDFLKLDIEGAEHDLMKGQPDWLAATRVVFAELHERIVPGCEAVFAAATANRSNSVDDRGEKILSIRQDQASTTEPAQPFTSSNSTSNISVALGGITPPAPRAP